MSTPTSHSVAYTNVLHVQDGNITSRPAKVTPHIALTQQKKKLPCDTLYTAPRRDADGKDYAQRVVLCTSKLGEPYFRSLNNETEAYGNRARAIANALGEAILPPAPKPWPDPAKALAPAPSPQAQAWAQAHPGHVPPSHAQTYDGASANSVVLMAAIDRLTSTIAQEIAAQHAWRKEVLEQARSIASALTTLLPPPSTDDNG